VGDVGRGSIQLRTEKENQAPTALGRLDVPPDPLVKEVWHCSLVGVTYGPKCFGVGRGVETPEESFVLGSRALLRVTAAG